MNPATPPRPPSKNADHKAVAAYYSELRRWAKALESWEDRLRQWEADLDTACDSGVMDDPQLVYDEGALRDDEEGCGCTSEEAEAGCGCTTCEKWRSDRAKDMMQRQQEAAKIGDEVQWLEELWSLSDKRRKKSGPNTQRPSRRYTNPHEGLGVD